MNFTPDQAHLENGPEIKLPISNITKWPFILSDLLLIILSMVLAFSSGTPLTAQAFGCCVFGVALGSVIAVIPFIFDHILNNKNRAFEYHLETKESLWLALEAELLSNQKNHLKRIEFLENKLQKIAHNNNYETPQALSTDAQAAADLKNIPSTPLKEAPLKPTSTPVEQSPSSISGATENKAEAAHPLNEKSPLLAKAIAQSQKNSPSKTVERIIGSLASKTEKS